VKKAGKYWRMTYRIDGKQKLLLLDVYPAVWLVSRTIFSQTGRAQAQGVESIAEFS
jgi:hypothetical protein